MTLRPAPKGKLCFRALAITLLLGLAGCNNAGTNLPPTGFRMRSGFVPSPFGYVPCSGPSVSRVATSGIVVSYQGDGSGTETQFSDHVTNDFGIDDHPNGRMNATWNFGFNFASSALSACGSALSMPGFFLPPNMVTIICGDCVCENCVLTNKGSNGKTCG